MPRLTNTQYVLDSLNLRYLWLNDSGCFALLSMTEQLLLHKYFEPDKDLNSQDRITYRVAITKTNPTLPQQAGRALARLSARIAIDAVRRSNESSNTRTNKDRHLVVTAVVRPEIDIKRLARIFYQLAEQQLEKRGASQAR